MFNRHNSTKYSAYRCSNELIQSTLLYVTQIFSVFLSVKLPKISSYISLLFILSYYNDFWARYKYPPYTSLTVLPFVLVYRMGLCQQPCDIVGLLTVPRIQKLHELPTTFLSTVCKCWICYSNICWRLILFEIYSPI